MAFSEGLAQVCIGKCQYEDGSYSGKFGFIDHSGQFVINPQYDNAWDFKNGFAKVTVGKGDDAKVGIYRQDRKSDLATIKLSLFVKHPPTTSPGSAPLQVPNPWL